MKLAVIFTGFIMLLSIFTSSFVPPRSYQSYAQATLDIVAVGDSIIWGQGLRDDDKMHRLVAREIEAETGLSVHITHLAHSGAIVGASWTHKFDWNKIPGGDEEKVQSILNQKYSRLPQFPLFVMDWSVPMVIKTDDRIIEIGPQCISFGCIGANIQLNNDLTSALLTVFVRDRIFDVSQTITRSFLQVRHEEGRLMVYDFNSRAHGEIPRSFPTISEQVDMFSYSPNDVDIILVDGCINNIGVSTISHSGTSEQQIRDAAENFCHDELKVLIREISNKFNNDDALIVVTGYYAAISDLTNFASIPAWIRGFFKANTPEQIQQIVRNWEVFHQESTRQIQNTVAEVNQEFRERYTEDRILFAYPSFGSENAIFATDPLLFGVSKGGFPLFLPEPVDPVSGEREEECNRIYRALQIGERIPCIIASIGHPNERGAARYAETIMNVIPDDHFDVELTPWRGWRLL